MSLCINPVRFGCQDPDLWQQKFLIWILSQNILTTQAEERLEIYQEKLEKISNLKDELKSHIAALPAIPQVNVKPILSIGIVVSRKLAAGI